MSNLQKEIYEDVQIVIEQKTIIKTNETVNTTNKNTNENTNKPNKLNIQVKGLKRNTIDKYYTKPSVVEQCIKLVKKYINISQK